MSAGFAGAKDPRSGVPCAWANGTLDCAVPGCRFHDERCLLVQRDRGEDVTKGTQIALLQADNAGLSSANALLEELLATARAERDELLCVLDDFLESLHRPG